MKISFAGVLAQAWAIAKRDGDLLLRVAAPFLFLPAFALTLFVPPMPLPDGDIADMEARSEAWITAASAWIDGYGLGIAGAYAITYFGVGVVIALYCDPQRPSVGQAIGRVARLYPRFLLAMILIALPAGAGMWLLVIPGLYVLGRTMLTAPVLLAEAPVGAWRAVRRSLALSRGNGLSLMALAAFAYAIGLLGGQPFLMLDGWMRAQGGGNPLAIAIVDAAAALVGMAAQLAVALFAVVAYRRLAAR